MRRVQIQLTPAAGKRLIAKAVVEREDVKKALKEGKIFVIGGTTNAYVANALLEAVGEEPSVKFEAFHRGVVVAPGTKLISAEQAGDLLIDHGKALFTKQEDLPEVCAGLGKGDIIFKGANAVHLASKTAGVLIGNPGNGGTIHEASGAVLSRRAKLILPVGVEKRVEVPVAQLSQLVLDPEAEGLRLFDAFPAAAPCCS